MRKMLRILKFEFFELYSQGNYVQNPEIFRKDEFLEIAKEFYYQNLKFKIVKNVKM